MKNALKKILASAMALTLLGTGTTAISPNSHHTFIAHAGYNHEYEHNCYSYQCRTLTGQWYESGSRTEYQPSGLWGWGAVKVTITTYKRTVLYQCAVCGKALSLGEEKYEKETGYDWGW